MGLAIRKELLRRRGVIASGRVRRPADRCLQPLVPLLEKHLRDPAHRHRDPLKEPTMDLGITGRTALVLGASGGLGSAIAVRLAEEGANVAAAGRSADKLADDREANPGRGRQGVAARWDLGDLDSVDRTSSRDREQPSARSTFW